MKSPAQKAFFQIMKRSLTEYMKTTARETHLAKLCRLYSSIPETRCLRDDCRKLCCSKINEAAPPNGKFMSLPLVYSIEYWNIDEYIRQNFTPDDCERFRDTERHEKLCVFFDQTNSLCRIYPARPLSCRLFGLKLPGLLWGLRFDKEAMDAVYCKGLEVLADEKYKEFIRHYCGLWDLMAVWSVENPVLTDEQSKITKEKIGSDNLYLLGWSEFNRLRCSSAEWLKENIGDFWQDYRQSL
jgi:Fe-S-cluster containining protein